MAKNETKERPILFSGEMVRAMLEGRKTQTRRVIKNIERLDGLMFEDEAEDWCPYGRPGDRLWVRETIDRLFPDKTGGRDYAIYRADGALTPLDNWPWKRDYLSSIHMPYGLARIWLEVTGVRVERVKSISYADARREGVFCASCNGYHSRACVCKRNFRRLWDEINADRGYPWESNPWVWVVEFQRLKP